MYYGRLFIQRSGGSLNFEQFCNYNTNCISFFVFVSLTNCFQRCLIMHGANFISFGQTHSQSLLDGYVLYATLFDMGISSYLINVTTLEQEGQVVILKFTVTLRLSSTFRVVI